MRDLMSKRQMLFITGKYTHLWEKKKVLSISSFILHNLIFICLYNILWMKDTKSLTLWSDFFSSILPILSEKIYVHAKLLQSCPTLRNSMEYSPPVSSVHGISQARILQWVAISSFKESSWPRDWTCISYIGRWVLYHWGTWEAPL